MAEEQKKDDFEIEVEDAPEVDRRTPEQIRQEQINVAKQQSKGKPQETEEGIEIIDDTPEEDRGREPMPKDIVKELEADELEEYSDKVKTRLHQMKKVWHDERRAKEAALREQQEAISLAQKILEENKKLKSRLSEGEKSYIDTAKNAAELELEMAKRAYKEAYESGEADRIVEAQEKFNAANYKLQRVNDYKPSLQQPEIEVQTEQSVVQRPPQLDAKTMDWQNKNPWWGTDEEMTALALGFHQKLEKQYGVGYVGTDEYWNRIDETMRKRFPDYEWGDEPEEIKTTNGGGKPVVRTETKPAATVVAPASRSTSSKKIVLKQSQIALAKKLGLTPEQYAREYAKTMENQNG